MAFDYLGGVVAITDSNTAVIPDWGFRCNTIAAGYRHTVGLKSDGTVVAVGDNGYGHCDLSGWWGMQFPV